MDEKSDIESMILQVGLGDRAAFSALYDATSAKLFGVCLRVLNNRAEAEDALQNVFVKVWQKARLYSANGYWRNNSYAIFNLGGWRVLCTALNCF